MTSAEGTVLAVDIGGTKMASAVVDGSGALLNRVRVPTPAGSRVRPGDEEEAERLFETLVELVDSTRWREHPVRAVGVGCGGPMSAGGRDVSPLNIPAWRSFPLAERLALHTGVEAFVDNDAKALALGEGWAGAAVGCRDYLAMVVSTGVGGGIVLDGRLLDGAAGNAGHIGHVVVEPGGRACVCGGAGCLEAEASGTAIALRTGGEAALAPPEEVTRAGVMVGRAVASVANLLDLPLALVAGSVALGFGAPFFEAAQGEMDRQATIGAARGAVVRPAGLGPDGPLVGAAAVGWRGLGVPVLGDPAAAATR